MERSFCKKCSRCGQREVAIGTITYEIQAHHDGNEYLVKIPSLTIPQCQKCGNISFDHDANEQVSRALRATVGLLQPEEIQQHRQKLALSQAELADMLGIDVAELARWENSQQIQWRSADRFLRAFFTMPELRRNLASKEAAQLSRTSS